MGGASARADATMWPHVICECVTLSPRPTLVPRAGQVVDTSGQPLAHARLEIVSPNGRDVALADADGRFTVRVPAKGAWPLTATDSGFDSVTQQVSGTTPGIVVFTLRPVGNSGQHCSERFPCRCPGDLFVRQEG